MKIHVMGTIGNAGERKKRWKQTTRRSATAGLGWLSYALEPATHESDGTHSRRRREEDGGI